MDELLSLKRFETLLPRKLEFQLTQVLSSQGIKKTTQQESEMLVEEKDAEKDVKRAKINTKDDHKKISQDITDIFSKKGRKKSKKIIKQRKQDEYQQKVEKSKQEREEQLQKFAENKREKIKQENIKRKAKPEQEKPKKRVKVSGSLLESEEFKTMVGKAGISAWNEQEDHKDETTEQTKQTVSSMLQEENTRKIRDKYDMEYDKGKVKKIRKKANPFSNPTNEFQRIENKGRKRYLEKEQKRRRILKENSKNSKFRSKRR
ncbi:unnamed protein product [Moneuplotes crassus]|uniref:Uncharacterized protein n=1 Tax=Euplotes crassus TaxID=5936 RepID=A0AAD1XLC2_EUPCR|nr:unnamed protein product [Moneuplotes crassus]